MYTDVSTLTAQEDRYGRLFFSRRRGHWLYTDVRHRLHALIALLSSLPLARAHHHSNPAFDLRRAYRRIIRTFWMSLLSMILATVLVIHLTPFLVTVGYFFGMILALLRSFRRMTPNNEQNQAAFASRYADCYPHDPSPSH